MGRFVEVPLSELGEIFTSGEIAQINEHQEQTMKQTPTPEDVWEKFMPTPTTQEEKEKYILLQQNVVEFDDEIEDQIMEDPTLLMVLDARRRTPDDKAISNAFRARRCIAALDILQASVDIQEAV